MAWGIDDLEKFVNGLRETFSGKSKPGFNPASKTIKSAIVNPLKLGAEFSGATQAYKGSKPDASVLDQGLGVLALLGWLGGQEATVAVKNALTPEYAYGLHVSPTANLKKIKTKPGLGLWDELDNVAGSNYFWNTTNPGSNEEKIATFNLMQKYIDRYAKMSPDKMSTVYSIRTPLKNIILDENWQEGPDSYRTLKKLKVLDSVRTRGSGIASSGANDIASKPELVDTANSFYDFLGRSLKKHGSNFDIGVLKKEDKKSFDKLMKIYKEEITRMNKSAGNR